jgi:hypothetical protein
MQRLRSVRLPLPTKKQSLYSGATEPGLYWFDSSLIGLIRAERSEQLKFCVTPYALAPNIESTLHASNGTISSWCPVIM